jgi:hypothetical protein
MMASRGMGAIAPSKMPKGVRKARRDDTDFTQYAEGGMLAPVPEPQFKHVKLPKKELAAALENAKNTGNVRLQQELIREQEIRKSLKDNYSDGGKVNAAGNYTKPSLRKRIVSQVKAAATHGTKAGQWSARKAQLVAKKYKAAGGGYRD